MSSLKGKSRSYISVNPFEQLVVSEESDLESDALVKAVRQKQKAEKEKQEKETIEKCDSVVLKPPANVQKFKPAKKLSDMRQNFPTGPFSAESHRIKSIDGLLRKNGTEIAILNEIQLDFVSRRSHLYEFAPPIVRSRPLFYRNILMCCQSYISGRNDGRCTANVLCNMLLNPSQIEILYGLKRETSRRVLAPFAEQHSSSQKQFLALLNSHLDVLKPANGMEKFESEKDVVELKGTFCDSSAIFLPLQPDFQANFGDFFARKTKIENGFSRGTVTDPTRLFAIIKGANEEFYCPASAVGITGIIDSTSDGVRELLFYGDQVAFKQLTLSSGFKVIDGKEYRRCIKVTNLSRPTRKAPEHQVSAPTLKTVTSAPASCSSPNDQENGEKRSVFMDFAAEIPFGDSEEGGSQSDDSSEIGLGYGSGAVFETAKLERNKIAEVERIFARAKVMRGEWMKIVISADILKGSVHFKSPLELLMFCKGRSHLFEVRKNSPVIRQRSTEYVDGMKEILQATRKAKKNVVNGWKSGLPLDCQR